jgi:hypothetical protein
MVVMAVPVASHTLPAIGDVISRAQQSPYQTRSQS